MDRNLHSILGLCLVILPIGALAFTVNDGAKTVQTDGSQQDTTNGWNYAVGKNQAGWKVTVGSPGGSATWTDPFTFASSYPITIQGAGELPAYTTNRGFIGTTYFTITPTYGGGYQFTLSCTESNPITFGNFWFNEWSAANALMLIDGNGVRNYRVTNIKFLHADNHGLVAVVGSQGDTSYGTGEGPYGLFDHIEIQSPGGGGYGIYPRDNGNWNNPMSWGTERAVYLEDSLFEAATLNNGSGPVDSHHGARMVIRNNTAINNAFGDHGSEPYTNSALQWEVISNHIVIKNGQGLSTAVLIRGGSAVVKGNVVDREGNGFANNFIYAAYYRSEPVGGSNPSPVQDRTNAATQYVGTHQPGCGRVAAPGQDPEYPNDLWGSVPIYAWDNTVNAPLNFGFFNTDNGSFMQQNRDYFTNSPMPGYVEYTYPHPLQTDGGGGGGASPGYPTNVRMP